jgi:hypothetical protein
MSVHSTRSLAKWAERKLQYSLRDRSAVSDPSAASCEALDAPLAGLAANDFFDPLTSTRTFSFFSY